MAASITRATSPCPTGICLGSDAGTFAIERYDLATGEVTTAVSGYGGRRPQPSPDGKRLAFIRRDKDQTDVIKNLATGEQEMIYGDLDMDMQEIWQSTAFIR